MLTLKSRWRCTVLLRREVRAGNSDLLGISCIPEIGGSCRIACKLGVFLLISSTLQKITIVFYGKQLWRFSFFVFFFKDHLKKMVGKYPVGNVGICVFFLKCRSEFRVNEAAVEERGLHLFGSCLLFCFPVSGSFPHLSCPHFGLSALRCSPESHCHVCISMWSPGVHRLESSSSKELCV